jgi:glycine/D-amino acid oxidase-like deaminating enzyme
MRIGIIGAGLAGSLLAWRLAEAGATVELATGPGGPPDATAVSGGAVRGWEDDPLQRALAAQSLAELLASPALRAWSGFTPAPTVLTGVPLRCLPGDLAPFGARAAGAADLAAVGWAGAPAPGTATLLCAAGGRIRPGRLRDAVLCRLERDPRVSVARRLGTGHDVLVYAAGAWTPGLLARAGLSTMDLRVKALRYAVYRYRGRRPPIFSDGALYGMPLDDRLLLAGRATDEWGVEPGAPPPRPAADVAAALAARLPGLRLGPAVQRVDATDCYADPPVLALRDVPGTGGRVRVFAGGSGAAAKTALAASARACAELLATRTIHPTPEEIP